MLAAAKENTKLTALHDQMDYIEVEIDTIKAQIKEEKSRLSTNDDESELESIKQQIVELTTRCCVLEENRDETQQKIKEMEGLIIENAETAKFAQKRAESASIRSKDVKQKTEQELTKVKEEITEIKREKQEKQEDALKEMSTKIEADRKNSETVGLVKEMQVIKEELDAIKYEMKKLGDLQTDVTWIKNFLSRNIQPNATEFTDTEQNPVEITHILPKRGLLRPTLSDESILPPIKETAKTKKPHRSHSNRASTDSVKLRVKGQPFTGGTRKLSLDLDEISHEKTDSFV